MRACCRVGDQANGRDCTKQITRRRAVADDGKRVLQGFLRLFEAGWKSTLGRIKIRIQMVHTNEENSLRKFPFGVQGDCHLGVMFFPGSAVEVFITFSASSCSRCAKFTLGPLASVLWIALDPLLVWYPQVIEHLSHFLDKLSLKRLGCA